MDCPSPRSVTRSTQIKASRNGVSSSAAFDFVEASDLSENRRQALLDEFIRFCQAALLTPMASNLRAAVWSSKRGEEGRTLSIGWYPTANEVRSALLDASFTPAEIVASSVCGDARLSGRLIVPWRDERGRVCTVVAIAVDGDQSGEPRDLYLRGGSRPRFLGLDSLHRSNRAVPELLAVGDVLLAATLQAQGRDAIVVSRPEAAWAQEEFESLASMGVGGMVLALTDAEIDHDAIRETVCAQLTAEVAPDLYVVRYSRAELEYETNPWSDRLLERWSKKRVHAYAFAAESLVRRYASSEFAAASTLQTIVKEALRIDGLARDATRQSHLDRHFWPALLDALGLDWRGLSRRLGRNWLSVRRDLARHRRRRVYAQVVGDLASALDAYDLDRFEEIVAHTYRLLERNEIDGESREKPGFNAVERPQVIGLPPRSSALRVWSETIPDGEWESQFHECEWTVEPNALSAPRHDSRRDMVAREPTEAAIRDLAYRLWDEAGRPTGMEQHFWYTAKHQLRRLKVDVTNDRRRRTRFIA